MIPNGADLDIFKPGPKNNWVREKHNLQDKFVVTYVGAHGVANHLIQLLEVAKQLKNQTDIAIMLVGDGMEKSMLKEKAAEWELDNVLFVDSVPKSEIVSYVAASDVCTAVLKKIDTFKTVYPNKLFDYMSAARPIILGIDGVARDLLESANAGIYAEPENAKAIADAVLTLKNDPVLQETYGSNGLTYVSQNFSRKVLSEKYIAILSSHVLTVPREKVVNN
jgi:glycosyltransferase involved in cell wall biosynthesis